MNKNHSALPQSQGASSNRHFAAARKRLGWWRLIERTALIVATASAAIGLYWTRESIKLSRETANKQLRAYLTISESGMSDLTKPGEVKFFATIKNCGQTPAYEVKMNARAAAGNVPIHFDLLKASSEQGAVIGAGEAAKHAVSLPIGREFASEVADGRSTAWFYGEVTYKDAFGAPHTTKFRLMSREGLPTRDLNPNGLYNAPEGNEAD